MKIRRPRWLAVVLLVISLIGGLFAGHAPILATLARAWVIDDAPARADLIVVLGGQIATRPPEAAELYRKGVADRVFVMRETPNPVLHADTPGEERSDHVVSFLLGQGIPPEAIVRSDGKVGSTREEAEAFSRWWRAQPESERPRSIVLVTDALHGRRARMEFRRTLGRGRVAVHVAPVAHRNYEITSWWRNEFGRHDFLSEIAKSAAALIRCHVRRPIRPRFSARPRPGRSRQPIHRVLSHG